MNSTRKIQPARSLPEPTPGRAGPGAALSGPGAEAGRAGACSCAAARDAGVDGLIVVDLPPEEDEELCLPALAAGLNFIRLTTPTTDDERLETVLRNTSGFVYYVSMTGVTGAAIKSRAAVGEAVRRIKGHTQLPVAVGFGIKSAEDAAVIGRDADGVVVGTALCNAIAHSLEDGRATAGTVAAATTLVRDLAAGARRARA